MVYGDSKLLRKQAYHTEPEQDPFAKELDVNDPLYCKACEKLFAKETVFKAHLLGKKHIQALKRSGRPREAMALESKANLKTKLEKRQRENSEPAPPAAVRGVQCGGRGAHTRVQDAKAEKRQKQEPKEVERYEPNYSSMAACISSLKEQEAEEERVAEATKQALFRKQQQAADKAARNIKDDGLGPKAMPEDPMKKEVAKDWWKGTAHAQGPQADTVDESRRGNWICQSQKCNAHENPRLFTTCQRCGAQRRIGQDGCQPQLKNTSQNYAKREWSRRRNTLDYENNKDSKTNYDNRDASGSAYKTKIPSFKGKSPSLLRIVALHGQFELPGISATHGGSCDPHTEMSFGWYTPVSAATANLAALDCWRVHPLEDSATNDK